jgi:hypothetical protein
VNVDVYKGTIIVNKKIGDRWVQFGIDYDTLVETGKAIVQDSDGEQVIAELVFEQED